jgi:hypothetical protein
MDVSEVPGERANSVQCFFDGFKLYKIRAISTPTRTVYECCEKRKDNRCPASVIRVTDDNGQMINIDYQRLHNHPPNPGEFETATLKHRLAIAVQEKRNKGAKHIFNGVMAASE